jgi:hypothetical protein
MNSFTTENKYQQQSQQLPRTTSRNQINPQQHTPPNSRINEVTVTYLSFLIHMGYIVTFFFHSLNCNIQVSGTALVSTKMLVRVQSVQQK